MPDVPESFFRVLLIRRGFIREKNQQARRCRQQDRLWLRNRRRPAWWREEHVILGG